MGLRFRKSFKIAPGVKLNVNKKSVGMTFGGKGAHYTVNSSGRRTTSIGVPGTGMYYQDVKNASAKSTSNQGFSQSSGQGFNQAAGECPCCGAANQQGFAFCKVCGQPLSTPTRQSQPTYSQPVYIPPQCTTPVRKKDHTNLIVFIVVAIITICVGRYMCGIWDKYDAEQKAKQESIAQQDAQRAQQAQQPLQPPTATNSNADAQNAQSDIPSDVQSDAAATDQNQADMVWYSAGGSKYHRNSSCSNMSNPQQITKEEAESMGLTPCKKCY
jgi:hypothetical protein